MEFFYNINSYINEIDLICYNILYNIYMFVYTAVNSVLGYCPLFYQLMYFYLPITIYFRLKKNSKNSEKASIFYNSTYNYIFFVSKYVVIYVYQNIKKFLHMYVFFLKKFSVYTIMLVTFFKKCTNFFWRPLFKKISYFGLYSSVRSKWYKNKK